ncbi:MAG: WG repeat-containing protein, partial [Clostridiales bacterium]|nr:WG repeat-containing protein [Clostridiales bacterium]
DAATPFENGKARVKKDGRWGILEKDGNVKWNTKHTLN